MAAVAAARCNPRLKVLYARLRSAGKPAKLAFIAVARKLVIIANAILRDQSLFKPATYKHSCPRARDDPSEATGTTAQAAIRTGSNS